MAEPQDPLPHTSFSVRINAVKAVCPFCQNEREIVRSHVIPEFFLRAIVDKRGRALAIHGSPRPARLVQQAFMHPLLCSSCESFLNDEYERPFLDFWREAVPGIARGPIYLLTVPSYAKFKLFLLSVLWRAGVCNARSFSKVTLGQHESQIRDMLLNQQPLSMHEYPILGALMLVPESLQVAHTLVSPFETTWEGSQGYMFGFGGCLWHFLLRREPLSKWAHEWILMEDGRIGFPAIHISELGSIDRSFRSYVELANAKGWRDPWRN